MTFYVIGISYKKADTSMRSKFSLSENRIDNLLSDIQQQQSGSMMVISTCNRTEIYGFAEHPFVLISLLCQYSNGTVDDFQQVGYVHKNNDAVTHLFMVGTGMDSQILGDFEIIGQLKKSFRLSKSKNLIDNYLERLVNAVIKASKRIKNETEISTGATSVAFASVHYILNNVKNISEKNILLYGTGKIGRNTCENLVKHVPENHLTVINRTLEKAEEIAQKLQIEVKHHDNLVQELAQTDILFVATGANNPTITLDNLPKNHPMTILDLSIPKNVHESVKNQPEFQVIDLDILSQMTDDTLENRKKYVPQALEIIDELKSEFIHWVEERKFAPAILALKNKLQEIKENELNYQRKKIPDFDEQQAEIISNRLIQKITTHFANHLKDETTDVDESMALISQVFQLQITE